ncbi:hypothetical protein [Kitasatospora paranensis]
MHFRTDLDYAGTSAYRYTAVHVRFPSVSPPGSHGATQQADIDVRPAGWPYPTASDMALRSDALIPVCILGPMTDTQRAQLTAALAQYGGPKSNSAC